MRCLLLVLLVFGFTVHAQDDKRASFARYRGWSEAQYENWMRVSQYVTISNGKRLAMDLYRPSASGQMVDKPLPVIWSYKRWHRAVFREGAIATDPDTRPWVREMLYHGYVVATVDAVGAGASEGSRSLPFMEEDVQAMYDITQWLAEQPFSDGNVGLYGASFQASMALLSGAKQPPALKAVVAEKPLFDLYDFTWGGGIFLDAFVGFWDALAKQLDRQNPPPPIDNDEGGQILRQARRQHRDSVLPSKHFEENNHRAADVYTKGSPHAFAERVAAAQIPTLLVSGWLDLNINDTLLWYNNLTGPKRLIVGPWANRGRNERLQTSEYHKWFDRYLKGIPNGVEEEEPIHYFIAGGRSRQRWRQVNAWPVATAEARPFFLAQGPSDTISSAVDGALADKPETTGKHDWVVNYETSSGTKTRWSNGYGRGGVALKYPDRTEASKLAMTYTSAPLTEDLEIAGYPVVKLYASSTIDDADVFVYLEAVEKDGGARYLTEGFLRASRRKTGTPSYNHPDIPWQSGLREDEAKLTPGQPVELEFALLPIAYIFQKDTRIRITVTCADRGNRLTPMERKPPTFTLHFGPGKDSRIYLPVTPTP